MPTTEVHADGACLRNPGPGGFAAIVRTPSGIYPSFTTTVTGKQSRTTNNRMELSAVIQGLRAVQKAVQEGKLPQTQQVTVFSDSKYVVDAHNKFWILNWQKNGWLNYNDKPVANPDLWQALIALDQELSTTYTWVRGHAGDEMNEKCDRLASKQARKADKKSGNITPNQPRNNKASNNSNPHPATSRNTSKQQKTPS